MNRITHILFPLILLVLLCCSCDNQYKARLVGIDSLVDVCPDSARMQLVAMQDEMDDAPGNVRNYYNLLRVKADNKASVTLTTDSLILPVVQYYEQHVAEGHLPEAYYLLGRAYSDMRESEKAMFYFHKTLQCDSTQVSDYLKSRTYAQMGYIFLRNQLYDEARSMQEVSFFYCKAIGDTLGMRYCREDIASISRLSDSLHIDEAQKASMLLKLQQINEKVKNGKLLQLNSDLKSKADKDRSLVTFITISLILLVIIAVVLAYLFSKIMLKRRENISENAVDLQAQIDVYKPVKRQFYDKEIDELLNNHIASGKALKPSDWSFIEERLLASFPTFRDNLYSVHSLSDTEYRVCMLIKIEVTPSRIAKLLSTTSSSVSQIRTRLQQKVFDGQGTAKDWDNYVLTL